MAPFVLVIICILILSISASAPTKVTVQLNNSSASSRSKQCVVVGGGPIALATALTLSNPPHCYDVIVLEQTDKVYKYDPTMAYLYLITPRGMTWFDMFPRAYEKLRQRGLFPEGGFSTRYIIPSDPEMPMPPAVKALAPGTSLATDIRNCWIPRHSLVLLLSEYCVEQEKMRLKSKDSNIGSIQLVYGKKVESVRSDTAGMLTVKCDDNTSYSAALVVGADGMDSTVRSCLADKSESSWLQSKSKSFAVRRFKSPATGLRLNALQFPPGMKIFNTTDSTVVMRPENIYQFRSVNTGRRNKVSLSFLPMKDPNMIRPANSISRPDHEIWSRRTGPAIKDFYVKAFPRIEFDKIVKDEEWDRFAKVNGTTFPYCQYSPGSVVSSPGGDTGVVLVGDACHAFPPDTGQGVNSGLQDVVALDRALRGCDIQSGKATNIRDSSLSLADALNIYQRNRGPEHKALVELARCGAPYQYRQSWRRDQVGAFLWLANVALRSFLHKVTFGFVPPGAMVVMMNHELTYLQVMRRAHFASRGLTLAFIILITIASLLAGRSVLNK